MGKAGSGFKKPAAKKKAFTKKDIIYTSLIAAAVVIFIVVLAIVITNDDFIRTKNGRLQMDDNWLIAEYPKNNTTRYYQIGEVGDIEGFTLSSESAGNSLKTYYPDDMTDNVAVVFVGATSSNHAQMASYLSAYTAAAYGCEAPVPELTELVGREGYFVQCFPNRPMEAITETAEGTEAAETEEIAAADETTEEIEVTETEETAEETEVAETEEAAEETEVAETEETEVAETEETSDETANELPGCMIYATIEYDDARCIYIQTNTVEEVTAEEARELIDTIADAITIIER